MNRFIFLLLSKKNFFCFSLPTKETEFRSVPDYGARKKFFYLIFLKPFFILDPQSTSKIRKHQSYPHDPSLEQMLGDYKKAGTS